MCLSKLWLAMVAGCMLVAGVGFALPELQEQKKETNPEYVKRTLHGWSIYINPVLLEKEAKLTEKALGLLDKQLLEVTQVIPAKAVEELRKVPLYFSPEYAGHRAKAEYHPGAEWLKKNNRDPEMARTVEFTNIRIYEAETNRMPNFPLHELAHAYHHRFLPGGYGNKEIEAAFIRAKEAKKYDKVERHYGNGKSNTFEKAYAMTNAMEYFAEATESYFVRNDFYPFTREELKKHDPEMLEVVKKLWGVEEPVPPQPVGLTALLQKESLSELAKAAREKGDANRGAVLFFQPFLSCAKCHDSGEATPLGPDIANAGKEATAEHLIESMLQPSKVIKKGYETLSISTNKGKTITGYLAEEKNGLLTIIDPAASKKISIPMNEVDERLTSKQSLMPEGLINLLSDRQQFLDLSKYLIEVAEGGPKRARELRPAQTTFVVAEYEKDINHAGLLRNLDQKAYKRGEAIYQRICANCHGTKDHPGSLPTSPKFASHIFKNGSDPYSLYTTLTYGYNQMAPQSWMVPKQKYDVIHYLREEYLKGQNPTQHTKVDESYLAKFPKGSTFGPEPASVEPWMAMDYGPSLNNTYEVSKSGPNISYKGIAVRLDSGTGGVSRGKAWAVFDHDTMRYAAAWTGDGFIDWKGIHFNGQHQVHPKITGTTHIENPVGPGWANPETGKFDDPRPLGRDKRPYGPLPRSWAQFKGTYAYGDQTVINYSVGDAEIMELEGVEYKPSTIFTRTLEIGKSSRDLFAQICSAELGLSVHPLGKKLEERQANYSPTTVEKRDGYYVLKIPATATPTRLKIRIAKDRTAMNEDVNVLRIPQPLKPLTTGGPKRWPEVLNTTVIKGNEDGPFAVDTFALPERNPWNALLRLTGFDFLPDKTRMAVCSWDGDVWIVSGIDKPEAGLSWQRIASGLFQPLGLKVRDGSIFVCCRDQIVKLHDLNGDGETDFYECFNNDHQVTEHFHEFAMGLQTDAEGNFYYAKSGRHALDCVVPHHGTLLKVSKDGAKTEILATGFRAANGVCLNPDGSYFVTDQEGFWTPKNRINLVEKGGFYGNMWGYTDVTDTSDKAMKQPLCWITNEFDRSPAEMIWVPKNTWGPLAGSLLNTSYGMGKIYVVPHEKVNGQVQGGMCALPLPIFPTGVMRPRFHPETGDLCVCGMYAWAGNVVTPGGFYRLRYTGKPSYLPTALKARKDAMEITFSEELSPNSMESRNFQVKVWGLKRTKNYGSKHIDEKLLEVKEVTLSSDRKTVRIVLPGLEPTWCMSISYQLNEVKGVIHNTVHSLGN